MRKIADIQADLATLDTFPWTNGPYNLAMIRVIQDTRELLQILLNVQTTLEAMNDKYILSLLEPDLTDEGTPDGIN